MTGDSNRKKGGLKKSKAHHQVRPSPYVGQAIKERGNQKIVKNGWQTMQANHSKRMNSRQILDIHGRKARVRPRPHQPVLSQYRTW